MVKWGHLQVIKDVIIPLGAKHLEARGKATSLNINERKVGRLINGFRV